MNEPKKITKEKIALLIIALILIASYLSFLIPNLSSIDFPKLTDVILSPIKYGDYRSYTLNKDGKYIYTNSFERIDLETGQVLESTSIDLTAFAMASKKYGLVEYETFSLSPDEKYLVISSPKEDTITENAPFYFHKNIIFNLESENFIPIVNDLDILSWNPVNSNILFTTKGFYQMENETEHPAEQIVDHPNYVGNGKLLWDSNTNLPMAFINLLDGKYIITKSEFNNDDINFPIDLFEIDNGEEIVIVDAFDPTGEFVIFQKYEILNSKLDSSIWILHWKSMEMIELFRMSEYDKSLPAILNIIWSADGTRILVERENTSFLIFEIEMPK